MTQLTVYQILMTPISMLFGLSLIISAVVNLHWSQLVFALLWLLIGRALRSISHLREHPRDILLLPLVTLVIFFIALPVKTWAGISMNKHGWLTRTHDRIGGEGQTEASLYRTTA
jgi:hypothetical protein